MGHGITNVKEAGYRHKGAWHGLGEVWEGELTPQQAHDRYMNFTVELSDNIVANFPSGETQVIDNKKALRRAGTNDIFQIVSDDYPLDQQPQILVDLAESLANENSNIIVESCVSLFGGRKIFMLLHSGSYEIGNKGDLTHNYLLLSNGYDGLETLKGTPTNFRVECANMLAMALGLGSAFSFKHRAGLVDRVKFAKEALKNWGKQNEAFAAKANEMSNVGVSKSDLEAFFVDVYRRVKGSIPDKETEADKYAKAQAHVARMVEIFDKESDKYGANRWIAGNAATQWVQRYSSNWRKTDDDYRNKENEINRNYFGTGLKFTSEVMAHAAFI